MHGKKIQGINVTRLGQTQHLSSTDNTQYTLYIPCQLTFVQIKQWINASTCYLCYTYSTITYYQKCRVQNCRGPIHFPTEILQIDLVLLHFSYFVYHCLFHDCLLLAQQQMSCRPLVEKLLQVRVRLVSQASLLYMCGLLCMTNADY